MSIFTITRRVIYADTDKMGIVYHSNYFRWFEMGRTEMLREMGLPYTEIETAGYNLPASEAFCKYLSPARYDDLIRVETRVDEIKKASVRFQYKIVNHNSGRVLVTGYTIHACVDNNGNVVRFPAFLEETLERGGNLLVQPENL